ncbi:MAG: Outer membrane protein [Pseudolabrys sp.]|jgi:outer membrane immunogenic protein|nr:Outer membrane protein [Pseudolabrys sp.]
MKSILVAGVSALALVVTFGAANAADMPVRQTMPTKAPVYVPPPFTWTGAYIGLNGGYGFGANSTFSGGTVPGGFHTSGWLFGGTLGYNWQTGPAVFGVEGDIDWADIHGSGICTGFACETKNDWLGTVRGRLGYNAGRWMPYVTGGLAFGGVKSSIDTFGGSSSTKAGWTLGGGVEAMLWGPWSAKLEYLYVDLGHVNDIPGTGGTSADFKTNIIRAGLNYHF